MDQVGKGYFSFLVLLMGSLWVDCRASGVMNGARDGMHNKAELVVKGGLSHGVGQPNQVASRGHHHGGRNAVG